MHTPPFVIDQTELSFTFLSPTTTVRFASFSFAYNCLHRGKAEGGLGEGRGGIGRLERVRASDRSGISVRAQFFFSTGTFGSQGHQCFAYSIRLFRVAVPPGRFCRFESIAPACQISLCRDWLVSI